MTGRQQSLHLQGVEAYRAGRHPLAVKLLSQYVAAVPGDAGGWSNLGSALQAAGQGAKAVDAFRRAIALLPLQAGFHYNLGNALIELGRHQDAAAAFSDAIRLRPGHAFSHHGLGLALFRLERLSSALAAVEQAAALGPTLAEPQALRASILAALGRRVEASAAFDRLAALDPVLAKKYRPQQVHARRHLCDWRQFGADEAAIRAMIAAGDLVSPFVAVTLETSPGEQLRAAIRQSREFADARPLASARMGKAGDKIRIGYLSGDFHAHATAYLTAELFEHHDRQRFHVTGYSIGPDDGSAMRQRLKDAFADFVDLREMGDDEAACRIHQDAPHILVDLKGYTAGARPRILARRPAPIQVNYLGFPGTMGAGFMDYVIADDTVIPPDHHRFYSEAVVSLPCYQCNDSTRGQDGASPERTACGLPPQGFVFCCFNASYKITPPLFDIWCRLLAAVPGSVLWLFQGDQAIQDNLRREASARGIDPSRLIFAPPLPLAQHLARQRLADLFLDTLPYNAHTTASDALLSGVPVLTCPGDSFASRVAASLVKGAGLADELVVDSLAGYESRALDLARDPARLAALKARVAKVRQGALFDTPAFAARLETAYDRMVARRRAGKPPEPFRVGPEPGSVRTAPPARE